MRESQRERVRERERNDVCLKQSGREKCCKFHFELNPHAANYVFTRYMFLFKTQNTTHKHIEQKQQKSKQATPTLDSTSYYKTILYFMCYTRYIKSDSIVNTVLVHLCVFMSIITWQNLCLCKQLHLLGRDQHMTVDINTIKSVNINTIKSNNTWLVSHRFQHDID